MSDLLTMLCAKLGTSLDRNGRAHATCPECGAEPRTQRGARAFHFYLYDLAGGKQGAVCWSCGYRASLTQLAARLDLTGYTPPTPRAIEAPPVAPWQAPGALVAYRTYQDQQFARVCDAWRSYKPLNSFTVKMADLGLGKLPLWSEERRAWYPYRHERLILPLMWGGEIIGMRGRAYLPEDDGPKWLTASFSQSLLCGLESVRRGDTVIWCENLADRLYAAQVEPGARYVASGGVSWRSEWLQDLAACQPAHVLIWFDNDAAGCGNPETLRADAQRRRQEGKPPRPAPRGPKLANELLALGVKASVYRWRAGTPEHADLAWLLSQSLVRRAA